MLRLSVLLHEGWAVTAEPLNITIASTKVVGICRIVQLPLTLLEPYPGALEVQPCMFGRGGPPATSEASPCDLSEGANLRPQSDVSQRL